MRRFGERMEMFFMSESLGNTLPATSPPWYQRRSGALLLLVVLAWLAYSNVFYTTFVFDDFDSIHLNQTIRWQSPYWQVLTPPFGVAVQNRPVVNLSLAVNFALSGLQPWSYQAFNLLVHIANAGLAYLLLRAVLTHSPSLAALRPRAWLLALIPAVIWVVHPLNTEGVTAIIQRTESMTMLCVLGMFYAAWQAHFATGARRYAWPALAVGACVLGAGCKEAMALAPILLVFFDRTFLYPSWRAVWEGRKGLYPGLLLGWIVLAGIVLQNGGTRGNVAGFGLGMEWYEYLRTQGGAIWLYLKLVFWPMPLVGDYGYPIENNPWRYGVACVSLGLLMLAGLACWKRCPWVAFVTLAFLLLLAPSSSFIPLINQTIAEKRMYFPSLLVIITVVFGALGRLSWLQRKFDLPAGLDRLLGGLMLVVILALAGQTWLRNCDYYSELDYWQSVVLHRQENYRGWMNYGVRLLDRNRSEEAQAALAVAVTLGGHDAVTHKYLAIALYRAGKDPNMVQALLQRSLAIRPGQPLALYYLGCVAQDHKQYRAAADYFTQAIAGHFDTPEVYLQRGEMYWQLGDHPAALTDLRQYQTATGKVPPVWQPRLTAPPPATLPGMGRK